MTGVCCDSGRGNETSPYWSSQHGPPAHWRDRDDAGRAAARYRAKLAEIVHPERVHDDVLRSRRQRHWQGERSGAGISTLMTMRAKSLIAASLALLASCQSPLRADAAEVPAQYRGLWCDRDDGSYYRCRKATSEGYMDIGRNRIKVDEETSCRIATVKPTAKGHRLTPNARLFRG
jgi:hypothetical protein